MIKSLNWVKFKLSRFKLTKLAHLEESTKIFSYYRKFELCWFELREFDCTDFLKYSIYIIYKYILTVIYLYKTSSIYMPKHLKRQPSKGVLFLVNLFEKYLWKRLFLEKLLAKSLLALTGIFQGFWCKKKSKN